MERSRIKLHSRRTDELCRSSILQPHGPVRHQLLHLISQRQQPTYFKQAYIGGLDTSPFQYGGIVPLVAIYSIDWNAYYAATNSTGTGHNSNSIKQGSDHVFPKVPDQHKVGQPLIPNGLGVLYVLFTTVYLFHFFIF